MRKLILASAAATFAVAGTAFAGVPVATGVPVVGASAGKACTGVFVGSLFMAVPNSDSNASAMLIALSAAEARGQTITAFVPSLDPTAEAICGAEATNPESTPGVPHLISFK